MKHSLIVRTFLLLRCVSIPAGPGRAAEEKVPLSSLDLGAMTAGRGKAQAKKSITGTFENSIQANVARHGVVLVRLFQP